MDWVRVKDKETGHHITVPASRADKAGYEVLDPETHPAVDRNGLPLGPKFNEPKGGAAKTPATDDKKGGAAK